MKKKSKKIINYILIIFMIIALLLPLVANFLPQQQSGQIDPNLVQAYIDSQNEQTETEEDFIEVPEMEGSYQVVDVPSGNTVTILWGDEKKDVKLIGVKEVSTTKEVLKNQLMNDFVQLEFDTKEADADGNLLAYAYRTDGTFINYDLILRGDAKVETNVSENTKYIVELQDAQVLAKSSQNGCWTEDTAREDEES